MDMGINPAPEFWHCRGKKCTGSQAMRGAGDEIKVLSRSSGKSVGFKERNRRQSLP